MKVFKHRELATPPPPHVDQRSPVNSTLKPSQKGWLLCQLLVSASHGQETQARAGNTLEMQAP